MAIISEGKYVTDNCMQTLIQLVKNQFNTRISDSDENDSTTNGANTLTVDTDLKPSSMTITYSG